MAEDHTLADHRKVFFAVDSSEHAAAAVRWAVDNFLQKDDALSLLHVAEFSPVAAADPLGHGAAFVADLNNEQEARAKESGAALLEATAKTCLHAVAKVHTVLLSASQGAKHAIASYCDDKKPEILLVSSRGLGAVKRFVLGSTSDHLIHHCSVPVLVIKPPAAPASGDHKE